MVDMSDQCQAIHSAQGCSCLQYFVFFCFVVGVYKLAAFLFTVFSSFWLSPLDLKKRYGGGWALVTGGSEGIGLSIAQELAQQDLNIILVSRSKEKLSRAKEQVLKINSKVEVEYHSIDFTTLTQPQHYKDAFKGILAKDISVLVNNVGYHLPDPMLENSYKQIRNEMLVNILPISVLTRLFLPKMMQRSHRSGIINMTSASALAPFPGCSHYSATKNYGDIFSRALEREIGGKIDVLTARPFFVSTTMTHNIEKIDWAKPRGSAQEIVKKLGRSRICYGPLAHRLHGALIELFNSPEIATAIYTRVFSQVRSEYKEKRA